MDKIFIQGLRVDCIIGIMPEERIKEQPLYMDITLEHSLKESASSGDIAYTINYAAVALRCSAYAKERKAMLLEELAQELSDLILKEFSSASVTIRLTKPQAVKEAAGVGIEITRTK